MIHMQQNSIDFNELNINYEVGNAQVLADMCEIAVLRPFDDRVMAFLNVLSKVLMSDKKAKEYPDIVTLGFWMRKANIEQIRERFYDVSDNVIKLGRGVCFHIAPSNVPVNYAYSLVTGLLCGNPNVVRIPSKDFPQVQIINAAINNALNDFDDIRPYICLVKYGHDQVINDAISSIADVRIIWGGDNTIAEIRKSPLKPRATEVTFADRFSIALIDSDSYMSVENKSKVAQDFYNDTYLTDQNACTSPRVVVWTGGQIDAAKKTFWGNLHGLINDKYELSGVQAVNKLTSGYILAAVKNGVKKSYAEDNLIVRMQVPELTKDLIDMRDNSGYFFEYECKDVLELKEICNDSRVQTLSYIGDKNAFLPLIESGISGIDRIVPVGKTMDFDLIWDGYNLFERLTRSVWMG